MWTGWIHRSQACPLICMFSRLTPAKRLPSINISVSSSKRSFQIASSISLPPPSRHFPHPLFQLLHFLIAIESILNEQPVKLPEVSFDRVCEHAQGLDFDVRVRGRLVKHDIRATSLKIECCCLYAGFQPTAQELQPRWQLPRPHVH